MSGFGFSGEHEAFREKVRAFAERELAPWSKKLAKARGMAPELLRKIGEAGFGGTNLPAKYGGHPADWISVGIQTEEMGKFDVFSFVLCYFSHMIFGVTQQNEDLRQQWLPRQIRGEVLLCAAFTEPTGGSDLAAIKTMAVKDGDDYIINGTKTCVTAATRADVILTLAKTNPEAGATGISTFLIPADLPGISRRFISLSGQNVCDQGEVIFKNVRVPVKYRCGEEGAGLRMWTPLWDIVRTGTSMVALAQAEASLSEAIEYAKQRTAFGKPIGKFEGVSFKIAEAATLIEAARLLVYRTLWLADQGIHHTKESAMIKWFCPEVALRVCNEALLIHGNFGYREKYPLEQRLRNCVGFQITDGITNIMKMVVAREILGREFLPYR